MSDFDSPWKEALTSYFEAFVAFFFPPLHADINWQRGFEMLDKELQQIAPDAEIGGRTVDVLAKVWLNSGNETWILIHVEVQTSEEAGFARRMFVYYSRLCDRYNRPVVSLAILADDRPTWRPGKFESSYGGCSVTFVFPIVKLVDWAADWESLEQNDNPFAMIVLAYLKARETRHDADKRMDWKIRLVKDVLGRVTSRKQFQKLFRLINWFLELPKPQEATFWSEIQKADKEKQVPYVTNLEKVIGEVAHEKGRREGHEAGHKSGREEGRQEGLRKGLLKAIQLGLKLQYKPIPAGVLAAARKINDVTRLEQLLDLIESKAPLAEIRKSLAEK